MLGSVITARDRWLKHGGLILPSNATVNFLHVLMGIWDGICREKYGRGREQCSRGWW